MPTGTDELAGIQWQDFLTFSGYPTEPVEFGVQFYGVHNCPASSSDTVLASRILRTRSAG